MNLGHPDASEAEKLQDRKGNDPLTSLAFYIIQGNAPSDPLV